MIIIVAMEFVRQWGRYSPDAERATCPLGKEAEGIVLNEHDCCAAWIKQLAVLNEQDCCAERAGLFRIMDQAIRCAE